MRSRIVVRRCFLLAAIVGLSLVPLGCGLQDGLAVAENGEAKTAAKKHPANRLAKESSPYLLLHAHNPVDWYPWGEAAFAKAKKENKPIFLSIGYSSCYWCHVMERKVFENEEIAKYMNEHFVNVKVDREERPDVDDIYMTSLHVYLQAIGSKQGGGWPLSMFLTPDGKPFAGGTYFPPENFQPIIKRVTDLWKNQRKQIVSNADVLTAEVRRLMKPRLSLKKIEIDRSIVADTAEALIDSFDPVHGGIDFNRGRPNGPKFPVPAKLELLQYTAASAKDAALRRKSLQAIAESLERIARGGIRDHLGGGFHRYSTDRFWHVPHFEKMLYDQAQLAPVYAAAFVRTKNVAFRQAAEGTLDYVLRDMTDKRGGFYSALDAETDGVEGEYYVWTPQQIEQTLGKEDAVVFGRAYGLREPKLFEHGHVLHHPKPLGEIAEGLKTTPAKLETRLQSMRKKLLDVRGKRTPLLRDDKILTSWNGLMIRGFARTGRLLARKDYVAAAEKAAVFILSNLRDKQGRLLRTWRDGKAKLNAYLDDYAFLVAGLLELHEATGEEKWLNAARRLTDQQIELYWDKVGKGFYFTRHDHEVLIARTKNAYDAVLPAGNSVSIRNLVRLAERTGEKKYLDHARDTLGVFLPHMAQTPRGLTHMALAAGEYLDQTGEKTGKTGTSAAPPRVQQAKAGKTGKGDILQVAAAAPASAKKMHKIRARAYLSTDKLPAGGTCRICVVIDIDEGWHINTNPPKPDTSIPTTIKIKSSAGVKLTGLKFPAGKKFMLPGLDEPQMVYEKQVAIYGLVQVPGSAEAADEIEIRVGYQACNDAVCLAPKTLKLTGKVPVAAGGQKVKQVNVKLFGRAPQQK